MIRVPAARKWLFVRPQGSMTMSSAELIASTTSGLASAFLPANRVALGAAIVGVNWS
jgi:hypothetical protein